MKQSAISRFEVQRIANWKLETLLKLADALDAQLEIRLIRAEEVIARFARQESGGSTPEQSVLQASPSQAHNEAGPLTRAMMPIGRSSDWKESRQRALQNSARDAAPEQQSAAA
jgi:hypothetical protein